MENNFKKAEELMLDMLKPTTAETQLEQTQQTQQEESFDDESDVEEESIDSTEEQVDQEAIADNKKLEDGDNADSTFEDWDGGEEEEVKESNVSFDFKKAAQEAGIELQDNSEQAFYAKLKEIREENIKLKDSTIDKQLESVPEDLREAIKLAKEGGDYLSFLGVSTIDYDQINDRDLMRYELQGFFQGEDAAQQLEEYLDDMGDVRLRIESRKLKDSLKIQQRMQKEQFLDSIKKRKEEAVQQLSKTLKEVDNVSGFKMSPKHKDNIFKAITNGDHVKSFTGKKEDGSFDYRTMVENYFLIANKDKIFDYLKQRANVAGKKELIQKVTNPTTGLSRAKQTANPGSSKKAPIDMLWDSLINR